MKISDFILRYSVPAGTWRDAICRVRVFAGLANGVAALVTDLDDKNTGTSVTNSVEWIWKTLVERGYVPQEASIIEHYEGDSLTDPTFDIVTFNGSSPHWETIPIAEAAVALRYSEEALLEKTQDDTRLVREIEKTRNQIDPYIDFPYQESHAISVRRLDIKEQMVPRSALSALVDAGASERELQDMIKSDLSLVAEVYAQPEEEYIAFSEFPVADGAVDFALFSGRSRMDVVLIEIKGANFPIVNRDGYENFSAKFNEAGQQIRRRLGYITREYEAFRNFVHATRRDVEAGRTRYNSFVGPQAPLKVSSAKDVNVRYVLIAGRTTNDISESRLRHEVESSFSRQLKAESWDSWINKLRRR